MLRRCFAGASACWRSACREYERGLTKTARLVTAFTRDDLLDADSTVVMFASEREALTAFSRLNTPALALDVPLTQDGTRVDLLSVSVIVREERALMIANFSTVDRAFDPALMAKVLKAVATRLVP